MAKEEKAEIKLERVYNVPLRMGFMKTPKYKRAKKAATTLREFLIKHMKSDNVKIGPYLNRKLWQHGIRNPPHHVKVNAKKDSEDVVFAELVGAPAPKPKEEPKKGKKGEKVEKKEEKKETKEEKKETKKEEKDVKAALEGKEVKKEEPKKPEVKKEAPKLTPKEAEVKKALTQ